MADKSLCTCTRTVPEVTVRPYLGPGVPLTRAPLAARHRRLGSCPWATMRAGPCPT